MLFFFGKQLQKHLDSDIPAHPLYFVPLLSGLGVAACSAIEDCRVQNK
jgi:hypothetical protein